jgi:hypothetical protein
MSLYCALLNRYGVVIRPSVKTITFSSSQIHNDNEKVIACWRDAQYSFNFFRSSYKPTFGMGPFSTRTEVLVRAVVAKAIRQDQQEALSDSKSQPRRAALPRRKAGSRGGTQEETSIVER